MDEIKQNPAEVDPQLVKEQAAGISGVKIYRSFSHKRKIASPGHALYVISFIKHKTQYKASAQVTKAWEEREGVDAVKKYLRENYVK